MKREGCKFLHNAFIRYRNVSLLDVNIRYCPNRDNNFLHSFEDPFVDLDIDESHEIPYYPCFFFKFVKRAILLCTVKERVIFIQRHLTISMLFNTVNAV